MRSKTLILTSLFAFGLAGAAGAATTKPTPAPAKVARMSAKAEAKHDKIEAKVEAKQDKMEAKAKHAKRAKSHVRHTKVAPKKVTKTPAKPAATHG